MIRAAIFDFEGPIVDLEFLHHEGHLQAARQVGIEMTVPEAILACPHFIGGPDIAVAEDIVNLLGGRVPHVTELEHRLRGQGVIREVEFLLDPRVILRLDREFYDRALREMTEIPLRDGFERTLGLIRWLNLKTVIATAIPKSDFDLVVSRSGIKRLFRPEDILWGDKQPSEDPGENVFVQALQYLGVSANEAVVIEDTHRGVAAAKAAGIPVIAIPVYWGNNLAALGNAGADVIVPNWAALSAYDGPRLLQYLESANGGQPK